ncbi:hypothetical protein [Deinococcus roseus]|uniref:HIG1 domain-containing protein n=1 Tax=Deinococcus roseus TaxID=392414 RepID=A0ABQ2CVE9_9DEIO|nr:hypothetical protein [Deinococcus roseus]GGJ18021.1 hypothetical protein GCM10008938_00160 [Deinococcus roseus]
MNEALWVLIALLVVVPAGLLVLVNTTLKGTHSGKTLRNIAYLQLAVAMVAIAVKIVRG